MPSPIREIKVTFPETVEVTDEQFTAMVQIVAWICDSYEASHPGRTMWPGEFGAMMLRHPASLSDDEPIPFDETILHIGCSEREDYSALCADCGRRQDEHDPFHVDPAAHEFRPAIPALPVPAWGRSVAKVKGAYRGPGVIRGWARTERGAERTIVAHRIEGGEGELLHIYSPAEIEVL